MIRTNLVLLSIIVFEDGLRGIKIWPALTDGGAGGIAGGFTSGLVQIGCGCYCQWSFGGLAQGIVEGPTDDGAVVVGEWAALMFSSQFKQLSAFQYVQELEVK